MNLTRPLCIYHGGCDDGFGAAWVVRKALGDDVEFYAGAYGKEPPRVGGRNVVLVDFSYKRPVLDDMARAANSILILDHHRTAQEDLAGFMIPCTAAEWRGGAWASRGSEIAGAKRICVAALFDMERSGAGIAWDYFIGGSRPPFVDYIEDRDLWRKSLPRGDEFTIALRSYPQDFAVWDHLSENVSNLMEEGAAIQRYYRLRVDELKRGAYPATFRVPEGSARVACSAWVANAPYFAASEVAGELAIEHPDAAFGACYFESEPGRWQYSLRSRGEFDVSAVAKRFGGGGHRAAAGFTTDEIVHSYAFFPVAG